MGFSVMFEDSADSKSGDSSKQTSSSHKTAKQDNADKASAPDPRAKQQNSSNEVPVGKAQEGKFATFPIKGGQINSGFGDRQDPIHRGAIEKHGGIDIPAPKGTPILAADDGVVIVAGKVSGFGNHAVYVQHKNGLTTVYGHGSAHHVTVGQTVRAGEQIADVGSEGMSTGDHLHFGVLKGFGVEGPRRQGIPLNPLDYFNIQSGIKNSLDLAKNKQNKQQQEKV